MGEPRRRERAPGGPRLLRLSLCTHQQRTRKLRLPESPDLRKELATQTQAGTELSSGRRSRGLARWARGSQREGTPRFCRIQRGHAVPASAPAVWPVVHLGLAHLAALAHPSGTQLSRLLPMAGHLLFQTGLHPSISHPRRSRPSLRLYEHASLPRLLRLHGLT